MAADSSSPHPRNRNERWLSGTNTLAPFMVAGLIVILINLQLLQAAAGLKVVQAGGESGESEQRVASNGCILDCLPNEHASYTAGIARVVRIEKNACVAPFRSVVVKDDYSRNDLPAAPATFKCVLDADSVLVDTIQVGSFTTIDCQGHKLTPSRLGTPGDLSRRSDPEVAFFLNGSYGVRIANCAIEGFDFGVFGIDSKIPSQYKSDPIALERLRNSVSSNAIYSRFYPVYLVTTDNTEITDNVVSFSSAGGIGISTIFDSDRNAIRNNVVTSNIGSSPLDGTPAVPGPIIPGSASSNPAFFSAAVGIFVAHIGGNANPTLLSAVVGGNLYQVAAPNSSSDESRSEDNTIEGNRVIFNRSGSGPAPNQVASSQAVRSVIRGNEVTRGNSGIIIAAALGTTRSFAGACSLDSRRLCLIDNDCSIPGFDAASKGMCTGATSQALNLANRDVVVEKNVLTGPFDLYGINVTPGASEVLIRNNSITGPALGAALRIAGSSLQPDTNRFTRNTITNVENAIRLEKMGALFFGAKYSLNDFTGYRTAAVTSNDYDLATELSADGLGNYWGLRCPGFDAALVRRLNGTVNLNVLDSHPFGIPVAGGIDLPATCQ